MIIYHFMLASRRAFVRSAWNWEDDAGNDDGDWEDDEGDDVSEIMQPLTLKNPHILFWSCFL